MSFARHFEVLAEIGRCKECIREYVLKIRWLLQGIPETSCGRYIALVDGLEQRYGDAYFQTYNRIQLQATETVEALQQLAADIECLSLAAYLPCPPAWKETFLEVIANPEEKHAVRVSVWWDLREAQTLDLSHVTYKSHYIYIGSDYRRYGRNQRGRSLKALATVDYIH